MRVILLCSALTLAPSAQSATLPDTPQGKAVLEFLAAVNDGTPPDIINVLEKYSSPQRLKKRTPEQMAEAYAQIKENYGTLSISKVISASSSAIVVVIIELDGDEAWWTFAFEPGEQVRFAGISGKVPEP